MTRQGAMTIVVALVAACVTTSIGRAAAAELAIDHRADRLVITSAGAPVVEYVFADPAIGRPSLRDLRGPGGTAITRPCPPRPGIDAVDHPTMHPGVMLCFSDLSGHDPWRHKTAVRFVGFEGEPVVRDDAATFTAMVEYLAAATDTPDAAVVCRERSTVTIADRLALGRPVRLVTWDAELTAGSAPVVFADVQEMGFGIRLAKELAPKGGGRYLASHGGRDEKGVFGRQAAWCDASGTVDGRRCGVTVVDGPGNPRPPFFHARDSGWLLANHFGVATYAKAPQKEGVAAGSGAITLAPGERMRLSCRFLLHGDVPDERLGDLVIAAVPLGGRGGRVVEVTTLADHGPGSLRAALEAGGPRNVIFRVFGRIDLATPLAVTKPFVTVWGEAAPGRIVIAGGPLTPKADQVELRDLTASTPAASEVLVAGRGSLRAGWPAALDSDHDGMNDAWERSRGLDPWNPADGPRVGDAAGLTNLEACLLGVAPRTPTADSDPLIGPEVIRRHVEYFNGLVVEDVVGAVPDAEAAAWLEANTPRFDCPDADLVETWYFRWWALRKHLRRTDAGRWVFTEFITRPAPVSSALGHQLMEGRWLRDPAYHDDSVDFWLDADQKAALHKYSQWLPHALWQRALVTGDPGFVTRRLDRLIADHRLWAEERQRPDGLYWQYDVRDAMEESISGGRHAKNVRPTINSYMAGSSLALAEIARHAGRTAEAEAFAAEGESLRKKLLATLWNPQSSFFEVVREDGSFAGVREALGFLPWYFALPPAGGGHEAAWREFTDEQGFRAPFGITTAERRHPDFRSHGIGTCEWDGAVWPFATSQTLVALATVLRGPPQNVVTNDDYLAALLTYARSHRWDGEPYLGEYLDEANGQWLKGRNPRSRWYNHSTFADLVIGGLVGIVPRLDDTLAIQPLLPADHWDWFCLEGVRYHGHELAIVWDRDGSRYGRGAGLTAWVDGRQTLHADTLTAISGPLVPR